MFIYTRVHFKFARKIYASELARLFYIVYAFRWGLCIKMCNFHHTFQTRFLFGLKIPIQFQCRSDESKSYPLECVITYLHFYWPHYFCLNHRIFIYCTMRNGEFFFPDMIYWGCCVLHVSILSWSIVWIKYFACNSKVIRVELIRLCI